MDFLNKAFAQVSELFKSMTPGARLTAGLLLAVIVISLGFLFQRQSSGPDAYLMDGEPFPATQLGAMEAAFSKANLTGAVRDGNRFKVPRGQQSAYMGALADAEVLPPNFGDYLGRAIASDSPFAMRGSREEKLKLAKQQELQLIIRSMRGIESASVLYDAKDKRSFAQDPVATASVNVKPQGTMELEPAQVRTVRNLVASAFAGLKPESVTVTDLNGRTYVGSSDSPGGGDSQDDAYASRKHMYEQEWNRKIREALYWIPAVVVQANVELDPQTGHEENVTTYDTKGVVYNQKETTGTKNVEPATPAGPPGFNAQQPGGINQAAKLSSAGGIKSTEETNHSESQTKVPTTIVRKTQHGLTPKSVTVTVGIPDSYYAKVWQQKNPTPDGQPPKPPIQTDLDQIKESVQKQVETATVWLLPPSELPADKYPRVKVVSFPDLPTQAPALPGMQDNALAWLAQNWTTLGMGGLTLFGLIFLRSMVKSMPVTSSPTTPSADAQPSLSVVSAADDEQPEESGGKRSRLKRRLGSGPSMRDELAEMVREDPDAAVSILRNWIGSAS
jgi:flagellar M-ring protein FliF